MNKNLNKEQSLEEIMKIHFEILEFFENTMDQKALLTLMDLLNKTIRIRRALWSKNFILLSLKKIIH
jgi:hypothetical protein